MVWAKIPAIEATMNEPRFERLLKKVAPILKCSPMSRLFPAGDGISPLSEMDAERELDGRSLHHHDRRDMHFHCRCVRAAIQDESKTIWSSLFRSDELQSLIKASCIYKQSLYTRKGQRAHPSRNSRQMKRPGKSNILVAPFDISVLVSLVRTVQARIHGAWQLH